MNIELTPACMDRTLFLRLARDYIETLAKFDNRIRWDEATWRSAMWRAKFIMDGRTVQGFAMVEETKFDFYPPALYIVEFFVVPEERNKGIGMEAVKEITKNWHGDIYFYVLKNNIKAMLFWTAVAEELGWKKTARPEIDEENGCRLMTYNVK